MPTEVAVDDDERCVCGHTRVAHEHYRAGTDCALCADHACARFRPAHRRRFLGVLPLPSALPLPPRRR